MNGCYSYYGSGKIKLKKTYSQPQNGTFAYLKMGMDFFIWSLGHRIVFKLLTPSKLL